MGDSAKGLWYPNCQLCSWDYQKKKRERERHKTMWGLSGSQDPFFRLGIMKRRVKRCFLVSHWLEMGLRGRREWVGNEQGNSSEEELGVLNEEGRSGCTENLFSVKPPSIRIK